MTEFLVLTFGAGGVIVSKVASEYLELVLPYLAETVTEYISLNELGTALDVKTGNDVAAGSDTRRIKAGCTEVIPVTHLSLVLHAKVMAAPVYNRLTCNTLVPDELKEIPVIIGSEYELGMLLCTSHGLHIDNSP